LVVAALLVIGGSVYLFKVVPVKRAGQRAEEILRLRKEADRAWSRAEFQRSQKLYEQINREAHTDLETDLREAILQLRVEGDTLSAKRRLEELVPKLIASEAKTRARIALAVANLQSGEPLEAQNSLMALVREPDAGPIAYFNLGCAQAANGLHAEAIETLKKLDSNPTLSGPSRLLRALLSLKDGTPKMALAATDLEAQGVQPAFHQELYTLGTVADWLDGNKKRSNQRLRIALDTDPMQTEEFFFDPLLYLEAIRWKQLLSFVRDYAGKAKSNGAKALYALALIKSDRRTEAQQFLAESLSPRINDADLQAISAYGLITQGRDDEARGALKFTKSRQEETPMIGTILDGRLFERAGYRSSADAVWSDLAKRPHAPIIAIVATARLESQIATEKGIGAVERLKVLYPNSVLVEKLHDEVFDSASSAGGATSSGKGIAP
jgi:tetratricopeptide (TPR) repeat protein